MAYYFIYVLGNFLYLTLSMTILTIFGLVSAFVGPKVGMRLGKKRAMVIGMLASAVGNTCIFLFARSSIATYIVIGCLMSVCSYFYAGFTVNYALDAGEYHLHKTGQDNRSVAVGMMTMPVKIGLALGGGIGGYGLSLIGYTAGMTTTPAFIGQFMVLFSIIPAAFYLIAALLMLIGYRITDADAVRYAKENAERLAAAIKPAEAPTD